MWLGFDTMASFITGTLGPGPLLPGPHYPPLSYLGMRVYVLGLE